ncbi:amino acid ABC transporter substrate-binding protein [Methanobrevibacter sp.]|uniref:amino acid ABC transporter substrate-binding protein n=1 Tax=Methanobrevibacter sp. TaxID=66852 RepID=UPI00388DFE2E
MNKKIGVILALVLVAFLVMGTASAGWFDFLGGDSSGSAVTNDNDTFIVGFDAEFPPYGFSENGEYVGFDLDLAQEVCDRNNWTLVKQPIDWDAKDSELNSGTIDCIWNGFTINGRESDYTWSEPYIDNKQVIIVKSDSGINSIEDLKGKTVETQKDSSALAALEGDNKTIADTFADLVQVADYNTAFMDLQSGACDAVAMDIGVAQYQISSSNSSDSYKILDTPISSEQYGVGFKLGNTDLKDQVQATLDEMYADGTISAIAENYTEYGVPGSLIQK